MDQITTDEAIKWYSDLNSMLKSHGLSQITVPTIDNTKASASQITPLTDKLTEMKSDTYYKLATFSDWGTISTGKQMKQINADGIATTISNVDTEIVCRNTATNSFGACSNGYNSLSQNYNGSCYNGTLAQAAESWWVGCDDGRYNQGYLTDTIRDYLGTCQQGSNTNGYKSNGLKTDGTNENTTVIDTKNTLATKTN